MNVLIIGGTRFAGRHITDLLLERGHAVTHFNRGLSIASGRRDVETIRGDRACDIHRLGDRIWDAVIDMCGFTPGIVELSTRYLAERTDRYVFVSSLSVYDLERAQAPDEDAPVMQLPEKASRNVMTPETYGALKALCEEIVLSTFRHRATVLRPGLIVGPYDQTDRFTYWPVRVAAGGDVLLPERERRIQYVDARDVAAFAVHAIEMRIAGTYNCATPAGAYTFGDLFEAGAEASRCPASPRYAPDAFLLENNVAPWSDLPLWVPDSPEYVGVANANVTRAVVQGLQFRSLQTTMRDTLRWAIAAGKRLGTLAAGLAPEREQAIVIAS